MKTPTLRRYRNGKSQNDLSRRINNKLLFGHFNESFFNSTKLITQSDFFDCITFLLTILMILFLLYRTILYFVIHWRMKAELKTRKALQAWQQDEEVGGGIIKIIAVFGTTPRQLRFLALNGT